MKANKILAAVVAISAAAISVAAGPAISQEVQAGIFKVGNGETQKIDRFGVCRVITNSGNNPIMVPVGSKMQWFEGDGAFLKYITEMREISASSCSAGFSEWICVAPFQVACPRGPYEATVTQMGVTVTEAQWGAVTPSEVAGASSSDLDELASRVCVGRSAGYYSLRAATTSEQGGGAYGLSLAWIFVCG